MYMCIFKGTLSLGVMSIMSKLAIKVYIFYQIES